MPYLTLMTSWMRCVFDDFNDWTDQLEYHHEDTEHNVEVGPVSGFCILLLLSCAEPSPFRHQEEDPRQYEAQGAHGDGWDEFKDEPNVEDDNGADDFKDI